MGLPWIAQDWMEFYEPGGTVSDYGSDLPDWNLPPVLVERIEGCSVQPVAVAGENLVEREAITTRWNFWVPDHHPQISATHRVKTSVTGDDLLMVDGDIPYFADPTGMELDHHQGFLKIVRG